MGRSNIVFCDLAALVRNSEIVFVVVQTPHDPAYGGATRMPEARMDFDYSHLVRGISELSAEIEQQGMERVVMVVSTVLPGTMERRIKPVLSHKSKLCYNPSFVAMGTAIPDFLEPEFVLLGVDDEWAAGRAEEFYRTISSAAICRTSVRNAELIKMAYNTFISMKIVFANTLMELAHKMGANVDEVTEALVQARERLLSPKYMSGGMGDGGGCHPRDCIAMSWLARQLHLSYDLFEDLMSAREKHTSWLADLMEEYDLPKVILGKAFKEGTRLVDGSPALLLRHILEERGHEVQMYDPHIDDQMPAFTRSVFLIGTRHPEFGEFRYPTGSVVIDPWRYIPDINGVEVVRLGGWSLGDRRDESTDSSLDHDEGAGEQLRGGA